MLQRSHYYPNVRPGLCCSDLTVVAADIPEQLTADGDYYPVEYLTVSDR